MNYCPYMERIKKKEKENGNIALTEVHQIHITRRFESVFLCFIVTQDLGTLHWNGSVIFTKIWYIQAMGLYEILHVFSQFDSDTPGM